MSFIILQLLYAITWMGASVPPQEVRSTPDIEVLSAKWKMVVRPGTIFDPGSPSTTIGHEGNDPMPVVVPNPRISGRSRKLTYYVYSAQIINHDQREIKGLAWNYVFYDRTTHEELKRQLGYRTVGLHHDQKALLEIRTGSSPPKVIDAGATGSGFEEHVVMQCVLFADGSMWAQPEIKDNLCERMRSNFKLKRSTGSGPIIY